MSAESSTLTWNGNGGVPGATPGCNGLGALGQLADGLQALHGGSAVSSLAGTHISLVPAAEGQLGLQASNIGVSSAAAGEATARSGSAS